ncbi:hypothetical protein FB45DRAFT_873312 [Roridomyces roridus]|uniref:Uncharacterized protein n=1 Tax=Roridomyces roridus TaxID=1738132 RepID=A0AAD7BBL2_9AGAR|nr:hypothetical protein FB45DRAFT_873312 [Roridomyces roridus]
MDKRAPTSRVGESGEGEVTRGPGDGMPVLLRADGGGRHSWSKDPSTTDSAEIPPESRNAKKINPSLSGIEKKTTCFRPHLDVGEWVCPPAGCQMGWWACPWWAYPLHGKGCGIVGMPTDGGHAHGGYAHLADKIVGMPTIGWWACPRMVGMPTLSGLFSCSSFRQKFYMMVHQAALGLCREDMVILR